MHTWHTFTYMHTHTTGRYSSFKKQSLLSTQKPSPQKHQRNKALILFGKYYIFIIFPMGILAEWNWKINLQSLQPRVSEATDKPECAVHHWQPVKRLQRQPVKRLQRQKEIILALFFIAKIQHAPHMFSRATITRSQIRLFDSTIGPA
jgi:hypothetical protein